MFDRTKSKVIQVKDAELGKRYQVLMGYPGCRYVWNMHTHKEGEIVECVTEYPDFRSEASGKKQCYTSSFLIREVE